MSIIKLFEEQMSDDVCDDEVMSFITSICQYLEIDEWREEL